MGADGISQALALYIKGQTGARDIQVLEFSRLSGGAIQSNYALSVQCVGGQHPGRLDLVVRSDALSTIAASLSREQEFQVLSVAYDAGVTVPQPLWLCTNTAIIGNAFCVMTRISGIAAGHKLVKELSAAQAKALTWQLGLELARLHQVRPPNARLAALPLPGPSPAQARILAYRSALDAIPEPHPALEWSLNWLQDQAPSSQGIALCHCDFRTGNYMVADGRLTGILDWEFAAWSDPYEDLGWLCSKSWRFGAFGKQVGEQSSLELALTGRMLPEIEFDVLTQIGELRSL